MKEKRLLEALSEVSDVFVEDMDIKINNVSERRHNKNSWIKWIGVAAVLALMISFGADFFTPKISSKNYFSASVTNGMISLEKEEPLLTKNPHLMGMPLMEYPVYKNLSYVEGAGGAPHYFTEEELLVMAEEIAEKLGTEIVEYSYALNQYSGFESEIETRSDAYEIVAQSELAEIRVLGNGKVSIYFNKTVSLTEGYHFSDDNTYVEAMQLIRYLAEEYDDLLGFENAADDCRIEYNLNGKKSLFYYAYNAAAEEPEAITEYCFNNVSFYGNEDGLSMIHYGDVRVASENMGDYEIVTEEEARQRLEEGNYVSIMLTEADALGGAFSDENIILVELTYLTGSTCQYYQPYYCFYVEIESYEAGYSNYGTFYVPALTDENLEKFPEVYPLGN